MQSQCDSKVDVTNKLLYKILEENIIIKRELIEIRKMMVTKK